MKGITVRQPHAARIAELTKRVENRSWSTSYRGPLIIQAGTRWDRRFPEAQRMPRGMVAVVRSFAVHRSDECESGAQYRQWGDGVFSCTEVGGLQPEDGRPPIYHWTLYGVVAVPEPRPLVGRLGLWTPPPDAADYAAELLERHP